jgi:hypothetical protein
MQSSQIPPKIPAPFASSQSGTLVNFPLPQSTTVSGGASWSEGFTITNATPLASGGVPPSVQDMNGVLEQISAWAQWFSVGGSVGYDSSFSTTIGGYPNGAILRTSTPNLFYISLVDNNTSNPTTGGANWETVRMVPNYTPAEPGINVNAGVVIGPGYSNTITLNFTAPCNGSVMSSGYLNVAAIAGGQITAALFNSLSGSPNSDISLASQTHKQVFAISAGQTVTISFQVTAASGAWSPVSASFEVDYFFVPLV